MKVVSVCIVPMRNWNFGRHRRSRKLFRASLYRTYEELKLCPSKKTAIPPYLVCIVPMRNWNSVKACNNGFDASPVCIVPMRNWNMYYTTSTLSHESVRLYRTYEELKRVFLSLALEAASVCIVPMRNWNSKWTNQKGYSLSIVCIVPMRNWNNSSSVKSFFAANACLYRTYEELKLFWCLWVNP